ncbi:MAG TPA: hypothetical protein VGK73_00475 [Polyangiaceae bacterium]
MGTRGLVLAFSILGLVGCGGKNTTDGRNRPSSGGTAGVGGGGTSAILEAGNGGVDDGAGATAATGNAGSSGSSAAGSSGAAGSGAGSGGAGGTAGSDAGGEGGVAADSGSGGEGGDADSGSSGSGGTPVNGPPIVRIRESATKKIDLLFMIDNSISMSDKQRFMGRAVPLLLARLVTPRCIDQDGDPTGTVASSGGVCASGAPEFPPLEDIHVGIITSSLGHHGSQDVCSETAGGRTPDDKAQLIGSVRTGIPGNEHGFLTWQPGNDTTALGADFTAQINSAGQLGCGYESSLESWYRFLVDPEPVGSMDNNGTTSVRGAVNEAVLAQRAAFLRPDSLLAIIMVSDENDCSILDENGAQGWLAGFKGGVNANNWRMPAATASCKTDPNHECCRPCILGPAPGCGDNAAEGCPDGNYLSIATDSMNQRCFQQVQRFGINLLYPSDRYASAIRETFIDPRLDGNLVPNPLFEPSGTLPGRAKDMVYLAGIIGVPWQDLATSESLSDPRRLDYLSARELLDLDRWSMISGNPGARPPIPPTDPLMIESIDPRPSGAQHPLSDQIPNSAIAPAGSNANAINGAEQAVDPATRDDLQFACIFPLEAPLPCDASNVSSCDCNADEYVKQSPICTYSAPSTDGVQIKAKAYPGLRQLEVLRKIGDQALVASICPKNITAEGDPLLDPNYGYNPAIGGILDRLREGIGPTCIERDLPAEQTADGERTTCAVIEAHRAEACECDESLGRMEPSDDDVGDALGQLRSDHQCGDTTGIDCDSFCLCEIRELEGDDLSACQNELVEPTESHGFCYIDTQSGTVNPAIVRSCPGYAKRALRFTGEGVVTDGAFALVVCD